MTEYQTTDQTLQQSDYILALRTQIVDSILLLGMLLGGIYLGIFLFYTPYNEWLPIDFFFIGIILAWACITLVRANISYSFKAMTIISLMYTVGLFDTIGRGLIGSGSVWLILVVLMSMTLFSRRAGLIAYGITVVTIALITLLVRLNIIVFNLDFEAYANSDIQWLIRAITISLICSIIVASIGRIVDVLGQQVIQFRRNSDELAKRQTDLSSEVQKRQTTELALADAVTHLKDLDRLKNNFIDSVSHELRTPLANIQLYHQLLAMKPEKASDYLETLKHETDRLSHIVEQMIHASSDEYNMQLSTMIEVDLGEIIKRLIAEHNDTCAKRDIQVKLGEIDKRYCTLATPEHIYRAVGNLVDNAVKYTPDGGEILIEMIRDETAQYPMVGLSLSNTGTCPSEQEQKQIFERFVRGKSSLEMGIAGAGLGLPISKQIVEKYDGYLRLTCADNLLTFTVCLPEITAISTRDEME